MAGTPVAGGSAVALLVSSGAPTAAALTIDNTISADGTAGTLTTPVFSTKAPNELLVLFASSGGPTSVSAKQTLAISGAGLTWTLVNRVNTQFGTAEIWKAYAPLPLVNATVTSAQSLVGGFHQSLTVVSFQGAGGTGATGGASAMFGATTGSLTTTGAGSLVYGVADDSARAAARMLGPNQLMVHQWTDAAAAYTFWVQSLAAPVADAGTAVTINDIGPTSDRWNLALVEILVGTALPKPTVPNLVGLTQPAASTALTDAGFTAGDVTTASSAIVPSGIVISQTPAAFTQVASGSAVSLVVSSGPPQVAVPNVVGLTQAAATTAITNAGLVVGTVTTASSMTVPSGSIISQSPAAATQVASGSAVSLVVSSGPPQVAVPNVVGLTQTGASSAITSASLTLGTVTTVSSTTMPSGSVISQTPAAATQVASGSAVSLVVSSGPPQVAVPNVLGLTQVAATTAIANAGLVVGTVTTTSSTTVPSGSVISQTPAAATQVASGSAVSLVVSSGPPQVAVPNVVGLTQTGASSAITGAGLTLGTVTTVSSTITPSGSVISQTPAAGTQVANGSAVALLVSSGPPQITVPNVVGLTQAAASTAIANAGLTVGAVTTELSTTVPPGSVISQTPAAGTQVATSSAVALVVASAPPEITVVVPNVVGLTQSTASTLITSAGLSVGTVSSAPSTTVPAGSVISQTPSAGATLAAGGAVNLVLSAGQALGTPQVDVIVSVDGNGAISTPAFSTGSAGELLVAFASSDGPNGSTRQTVNISGGGLAWALVRRANAQFGTAEIWTATAPGPLVNAVVSATQSSTTFHQSLTIVAFRGAGGIGDAVPASGHRTLPMVSLITTQAGSLIYGVGVDPDRSIGRTLASDEAIVHQWIDKGSNKTFWVQAFVAPVTNGGSVATIYDTAPSSDSWNMVAIEIVPR